MLTEAELIVKEKVRIEAEYRRREAENARDLYSPWQPAENFLLSERRAVAALMLHRSGKFPEAGDQCLEIGFGRLGWLADLISWGLNETDLHGIELDKIRGSLAMQALPNADLRIGDATKLPWEDAYFKFVIASTVFSSVLDLNVRRIIAGEMARVLTPGGAVIWYDLATNNPKNKNVKCLDAAAVKGLFPGFDCVLKSITLAPPIARLVVPYSRTLASLLGAVPLLRTHYVGILTKK